METYKSDIRIIAGSLKGRKVTCIVDEELRPTPQRVREALFSILGNAIPNRPFIDIFSGTGVIGIEAISRGASSATLLERDTKLANAIDSYLKKFAITDKAIVIRTDVYRWVERWLPPQEPVNCFFSPPFVDLTERVQDFLAVVEKLMNKVPDDSCVVVQAEDGFDPAFLPDPENWDQRKYGRNLLFIWVKGSPLESDDDEDRESGIGNRESEEESED
jgi:16S rRNA (guanine(966)-N(2))-methyltransferase RsmD